MTEIPKSYSDIRIDEEISNDHEELFGNLSKTCERYGFDGPTLFKNGLLSEKTGEFTIYILKHLRGNNEEDQLYIQTRLEAFAELSEEIKAALYEIMLKRPLNLSAETQHLILIQNHVTSVHQRVITSKRVATEILSRYFQIFRLMLKCKKYQSITAILSNIEYIKSIQSKIIQAEHLYQIGHYFESFELCSGLKSSQCITRKLKLWTSLEKTVNNIISSIRDTLEKRIISILYGFDPVEFIQTFEYYKKLDSVDDFEEVTKRLIQKEVKNCLTGIIEMSFNKPPEEDPTDESNSGSSISFSDASSSDDLIEKISSTYKDKKDCDIEASIKSGIDSLDFLYKKILHFVCFYSWIKNNWTNDVKALTNAIPNPFNCSVKSLKSDESSLFHKFLQELSMRFSNIIMAFTKITSNMKTSNILSVLLHVESFQFCNEDSNIYPECVNTETKNMFVSMIRKIQWISLEELRLYIENEPWTEFPCEKSIAYPFFDHSLSLMRNNDSNAESKTHEDSCVSDKDEAPPLILCNSAMNVIKIYSKYLQLLRITSIQSLVLTLYIFTLEYYIYAAFYRLHLNLLETQTPSYFSSNYSTYSILTDLLKKIDKAISGNIKPCIPSKSISSEGTEDIRISLDIFKSHAIAFSSIKVLVEKLNFLPEAYKIEAGIEMNQSNKELLCSYVSKTDNLLDNIIVSLCQKYIMTFYSPDSIKQEMATIKWDISTFPTNCNNYVQNLISYLQMHSQICGKLSEELGKDCSVKMFVERSWKILISNICHTMVEGFSLAKKCSQEGRVLMQLDFQQFLTSLTEIFSNRIENKDRELVEIFIKSFYFTKEQFELMMSDSKSYSPDQIKRLTALMKPETNVNTNKLKNIFSRKSNKS